MQIISIRYIFFAFLKAKITFTCVTIYDTLQRQHNLLSSLEHNSLMKYKRFANPNIALPDWYVACPAKNLSAKKIVAFELAKKKLLVFRDNDGKPQVLSRKCPHIGADLAIGKIINGRIPFVLVRKVWLG